MSDHVHIVILIPSKYAAVSQVVGFIKGKSAIHIAWTYSGHRRNYVGHHLWVGGYGVWSTEHITDEIVQEYLEHHRDAANIILE
ncbi:MAG TPA: hypothetical protein ENI67_03415 [Gammaproteobacteria bacterium]|nr:hypothetical protein [Gammaproteobacteria bacterium]